MGNQHVSVVVLPVTDLEASITFFTDVVGFPLLRRVGPNYAMVDGGPLAIGLSVAADGNDVGGKHMLGMRTDDVDALAQAIGQNGGTVVQAPHDAGDERRAFVHDNAGNLLMIYKR